MDRRSHRIRGVRGPIVVVAFLLLTAAGVFGGYMALRDYPKPSDIVDIVNLDGRSAVLVRAVDGPDDRSFVSLFQGTGGERWGAMIPEYRVPSPARAALAVTAEVVFVRSDASGQWAFFAFDLARGQKLGRIEPFETRASGPGRGLQRVGSLADRGQAFEFGGDDGDWAVIFAFDLRTGMLTWTAELGAVTIERAWLRERHVALATAEELLVVDRAQGNVVTRVPKRGVPCATADTIYGNDQRGVFALELARVADPASGADKDALRRLDIGPVEILGRCASHSGRMIFAIRDERGPALLALAQPPAQPGARRNPDSAWRVALPGPWPLDELAWQTPDRVSLSGTVSGFLPVLADQHLLMIELSSGRVVWRTDDPRVTRSAYLMRADGRLYLYRATDDTLVVFDDQTGQLLAARQLDGFGPVWPRNIAGGTIWLARGATFAILDGQTLEPLPSDGESQVGRDVRADFAAKL